MTKEALKLALEALERLDGWLALRYGSGLTPEEKQTVTAIKEALAQPEQEPVALETVYETIIQWDEGGGKRSRRELARRIVSLYTTPPQRTWVGLTPQERDEINDQVYGAVPHHVAFHHAIEAKLKEKNHEWLA